MTAKKKSSEYTAGQIQVLKRLEAVRKRPGMYIGSTSARGLHHLVYEVVDNSIDEAMAGFCKEITVSIGEGDIITVVEPLGRIEKCPLNKPAHIQLCPLHRRIDDAVQLIEKAFADTTLAQLAEEIETNDRACQFPINLDFKPHPANDEG